MQLVLDEVMERVPLGESGYEAFPVLPDSSDQIGGDADIELAITLARQQIHTGLFHAIHPRSSFLAHLSGEGRSSKIPKQSDPESSDFDQPMIDGFQQRHPPTTPDYAVTGM